MVLIIVLLLSLALMTLAERKVMGVIQRRVGPNKVGYSGILQPISDGLKLVLKENVVPSHSNSNIYKVAPIITLLLSLIGWVVIPLNGTTMISDHPLGVMFILAVSSLSVYGIVFTGWGGNSKYALLGSIRSTAQMISYEIVLSLIVLSVIMKMGDTPNLVSIVKSQEPMWYMIPLLPVGGIFLICALAETARAPFDLPEAESELVAGYVVENSSLSFAFFFLAEYLNIILMSVMMVILFMGGWGSDLKGLSGMVGENWAMLEGSILYGVKISLILYVFVWVRATYPRYRYDQLMSIAWKSQLPITIGIIMLIPSLIIVLLG